MEKNLKAIIRAYLFVIGMVVVVGLALLFHRVGRGLAQYGLPRTAIIAIFLMSGITISLGQIKGELRRWPCHLLIQGFSFVLIPAAVYLTSAWLPDGPLRYGVLLAAVVPTTISSCVVLTTATGGSTACALVNAVGGNLLGIVISPLLLGLMISRREALGFADAGRTIASLCLIVLLPFAIGRLLGRSSEGLQRRTEKIQSVAAPVCVLLVIFCAFAQSRDRLAPELGTVWRCCLYLAGAHVAFTALSIAVTRSLRISARESAAVAFCSTQKTLAMGLPLAQCFFAGSGFEVELIMLPLIFYHLFQLAFGSLLIPWWRRRIGSGREVPQGTMT